MTFSGHRNFEGFKVLNKITFIDSFAREILETNPETRFLHPIVMMLTYRIIKFLAIAVFRRAHIAIIP